jgi:hypothetical protein
MIVYWWVSVKISFLKVFLLQQLKLLLVLCSKLNEVEGKEQYHVQVSNRFAALEDLDTQAEINSAWQTIREDINI